MQKFYSKKKLSFRDRFKLSVATAVYYSGLYHLHLLLKRIFRRGRPHILCFHNISPIFPDCYSIALHPELFEQQIKFLLQHYTIVSLAKATELLKNNARLPNDVYAITFDDCYKGLVNYVLPIAEKHRFPFAAFLSTGPIDTGMPHTFDIILDLVDSTKKREVDLSAWGLGVFPLNDPLNNYNFAAALMIFFKTKSADEQKNYLEKLYRALETHPRQHYFSDMLLTWNDCQDLARSKWVTVGAHTVHHLQLSSLPKEECKAEILSSKETLENKLCLAVDYFAYPFGGVEDYNKDVVDLIEQCGFKYGYVLHNEVQQFHPFQLPRRNVHSGISGYYGKFHNALFAVEISGLGNMVFCKRLLRKARGLKRDKTASLYNSDK